MKLQLLKSVIFTFILVFLLLPAILSGELVPVDNVITIQKNSNHDVLYGPAYYNSSEYYKLEFTKRVAPTVLALGTSRVMQFREYFFLDKDKFYNAGGAVSQLNEFENFFNNLGNDSPSVVIISLDQYFFNESWSGELYKYEKSPVHYSLNVGELYKKLFDDYKIGKFKIQDLLNNSKSIGINSIVNKNGFLNDGSYYYGKSYSNQRLTSLSSFDSCLDRIENGNARFEYAEHMNMDAIEHLKSLLEYCWQNDIYVIAFLPPYAPTTLSHMNSLENRYNYMAEIYPNISNLFDLYDYELYDYTNINSLGITDDSFFIDGFHGSNIVYLKILINMIESNSILSDYCDINLLKDMYEKRFSNLEVFE